MKIELSTDDDDAKSVFRRIAQEDPDVAFIPPRSRQDGMAVLTLVIENYQQLAAGTVALIAALRGQMPTIRMTKDGLEVRGAEKEKFFATDQ